MAGGQRRQGRDREDDQNGRIAGRLGVAHPKPEKATQVVEAADAAPVDEGLGRGFHPMLGLESVGRFAGLQPTVIDLITFGFQQVSRSQAPGADMIGHDHAIEDSDGTCVARHRRLLHR
ncbi:hypothetical protein D3C73_1403690 [compost metagenome]